MQRGISQFSIAPTNMNGPLRTLAVPYNAGVQLSHCGHSCMAQHFCQLKRRCADKTVIGCKCAVDSPWQDMDHAQQRACFVVLR
jgi:hypothetical protein